MDSKDEEVINFHVETRETAFDPTLEQVASFESVPDKYR